MVCGRVSARAVDALQCSLLMRVNVAADNVTHLVVVMVASSCDRYNKFWGVVVVVVWIVIYDLMWFNFVDARHSR